MSDIAWQNGVIGSNNRMRELYTTAHLIIYYFIEIEGAKGVEKLRAFRDANRREMQAFLKMPGVGMDADGSIRYPSGLRLPENTGSTSNDPRMLNLRGIGALLSGESPKVVGERIEEALRRNIGTWLSFSENPSTTPIIINH